MAHARPATTEDLEGLLSLYCASEVSPAAEQPEPIWREMLDHPGMSVLVASKDKQLVATATLITAPNLLRSGRRHGFLENVLTHPAHQRQGFGAAVVRAAMDKAWDTGCHHILLQSGRADPGVHAFYRRLGFEPGLREAYVAHGPR